MTVDPLGYLLAAHITPANEQERAQVHHTTGPTVKLAFPNQAY